MLIKFQIKLFTLCFKYKIKISGCWREFYQRKSNYFFKLSFKECMQGKRQLYNNRFKDGVNNVAIMLQQKLIAHNYKT